MEKIDRQEYSVVVSNILGHKTYYCTTYTRDDSVYKLFDKSDNFIAEIVITDGYTIEITSSKKE